MENRVIIIGAGAAGLSAAIELAKNGQRSYLISDMPSQRAQSVMAEGGINAACDQKSDSFMLHAKETFEAGRKIADFDAIKDMTKQAPKIIEDLFEKGMAFSLDEEGMPDVRAFGGQSVKRTFYAAANTGKQLMHTLIEQSRRYEAQDLIKRMTGWSFFTLLHEKNMAQGCVLFHTITHEKKKLYGKMIIASGGLGAMFGNATGSVKNTGAVTANLFVNGVSFANGEFIQYHPTTVKTSSKNMLITEAVRGEGGRLFILKDKIPYYFMEEKYPSLGNLMPRDVVSREEWQWMKEGYQIYLDMRHLEKDIQYTKLRGVIEDCKRFLKIDPTKEPIPVEPGIHYFMGGIWVDRNHRTSMKYLYAAGECACQYHGANRLGGNSLLGAIYGGKTAARSVMEDPEYVTEKTPEMRKDDKKIDDIKTCDIGESWLSMQTILKNGLGIIREEKTIEQAILKMDELLKKVAETYDKAALETENQALQNCIVLGKAMLVCAKERKESRGAHTRSDYMQESEKYQKQTIARYSNGEILIDFRKAGELYED